MACCETLFKIMEHSKYLPKYAVNKESEQHSFVQPLNLSKDDSNIEAVMIKCEPIDDYNYLGQSTCENTPEHNQAPNMIPIEIDIANKYIENSVELEIKQEPSDEISFKEKNVAVNQYECPGLNAIKIEVEIEPVDAKASINTYIDAEDANASCSTFNKHQEIAKEQLFKNLTKLGSRIQNLNDDSIKKYPCKQCDRVFTKRNTLTKHVYLHLNIKYTCDECQKEFSSKHNMLRHKNVHNGVKAFACDHCGKSFMEKTYLAAHLRTHVIDKYYKCSVCRKEFRERAHLIRHERIHSGERPYECEVCHKQFKQSAHLSCHRKIHKKKIVLYCDMCKEGFLEKEDLYEHHKVHIGEKAFSCEYCHRQFGQKSHLQDHIRVHNGNRPFVCHLCEKTFSQRSTLNRHIRNHSQEKPYPCPICKKRFKQKTHVTKHVKIHERANEFILPTTIDKDMKDALIKKLQDDVCPDSNDDLVINVQENNKTVTNNISSEEDSDLISPEELGITKNKTLVKGFDDSGFGIDIEILKIKEEI